MPEYIERERIEKFFDGIYDCADLVFEPNDHCCAADDCGHCKWYEAKNAIQKRILSIPVANVVEVVLCRDCIFRSNEWTGCPKLNGTITDDEFFCAAGIKRDET